MRLRSFASLALAAATATLATLSPTQGAAQESSTALSTSIPEEFAELRIKDERVQRLGYRLAVANASYCETTRPSLGLLLHDIAAYGEPDRLRSALGLTGDIAVQAVVPGDPAIELLAVDTTIESVAGTPVSAVPFERKRKWWRMTQLNALLDQSLDRSGTASFGLPDGETVTITGTPACASSFEIGAIGKRAVADGSRVVIGEKFPGLDYADPELAAVIAHELAHNVLAHRALLDAQGRKRKLVRATEREADRLAPWLLANAGFDPQAALRFMQAWGPDHSGGWLLRKRTHDGWDERAEMIANEVAIVRARLDAGGMADWKTHFQREPETQID
ncbi:hypothetical protein ACFCW2_05010 [Qipengyuania sp. DSG2-2]|uniref:hypothetical protein n=1 Tax=Qipengyuania sp. DGS2-2 TaxID=3349631 RepID=UPI0036D3D795